MFGSLLTLKNNIAMDLLKLFSMLLILVLQSASFAQVTAYNFDPNKVNKNLLRPWIRSFRKTKNIGWS